MTTAPNTAAATTPAGGEPALSVAYGGSATAHGWDDVLARYAHWAGRNPTAPAVEDGELMWTYAELDALAARTADALRERVRPGDLVGVCLDRSVALVATAVALARLGAVYLPLGPRPGERRLAAVTRGLRVTCVIGAPGALPGAYGTGERLALPLPGTGANAHAEAVAAFPATPPGDTALPGAPEGTFYAVLTSGSTGVPKAVAVAGPALAARLRWYADRVGAGPGERHSLLVGVSFDPHVLELWTALTSGATLTVAPDDVRWDPRTLTDWWRRARVTLAILPTPLAELVLERPWPDLPDLRHLSIGGDRLHRHPGADVTARVDNAYGPAETAVVATTQALEPRGGPGVPAIGTPVDGAVVCVTDDGGRIVPRGEPGELRIGGTGLATGYLDASLTARRFVAPPPELTGTDRVYRTGDRVRMRPDGVLEFLGRMDGQVKVRGARIEPAEAEAAFEDDARVLGAVVAAETTAGGDTRLVAFVRPAPGADVPPAAELLEEVRGRLPEQAVPSAVHLVTEFPLDANGKVDRAALLAGRRQRPAGSWTARGTASPTEELVVELCRRVLGRPGTALEDNFVACGGNSLAAARLLTALEERFGVRLRAPQVLRQPDLRALAALVDSRREAAGVTKPQGHASPAPGAPGGVLGRVLDHARTSPSALAVSDGDLALTYAELTGAARRLAGALRARGVGPGTAVGLLLPHSVGVVVAQLAVWWAGGHYVPLDAAYPRARTEAMAAHAGVTLIVGEKDLLEAAGTLAGDVLALSAAGTVGGGPEPTAEDLPEPCAYDPDALAYVMYTSGSTGRPKGVGITHRGVAGLTVAPDYLTVTPRDRVLFHSAQAFDAAPFEVWVALANGAAVVVSTGDRQSFERLARDVERLGATVAFLTTALFHQLATRRSPVFAVLRGVAVGGEALSARHARAVLRAHPWLELVNGYGPTEATTFATAHRVREADCDAPPPIGRPIAGATAHVLDGHGEPLPAGVRGELWIGGPRLAAGYLGRPDVTAERFVRHPAAGRLYRTGDLVSARPDGTLDFHGRVDEQVKVRGFRIEPGEVEHALRAHPRVADAAVTVVRAGADDARLAAFVVPKCGGHLAVAALRDHLAGRLPAHLLPTAWSVVEDLPLTATGKVDRRALADRPVPGFPRPEAPPAPELTPVQQAVAEAWGRALQCEVTDPEADFLALGGHSLLALAVVDDLHEDLGVELTLAAFFSSPTVAGQAVLVEEALAAAYPAGTGAEGDGR
ncbi:amino acid adenylation domain-containing protein [Streptomyces cinnamoneus]|uniref:amino acid adenylation domain-containing protein n=1 Tax=Streptomyces cinnamoneus TaxID=53446 RepID=UPI001EFCAFE8|nr:amino acid adenylation domain-containing protein [Streptomyces cinnamoneus]